jgi:energy-coupling factor transport system permease protein
MLDPRTKLFLALVFAVSVMATGFMVVLAVQWGFVILAVFWLKEGLTYGRWLRLVVPMAVFFGAVTWWSAGSEAGVVAALKLVALSSGFFVFFVVTVPEDLGAALVKMGLPYPVAFVMSAAMQFAPIIGRKARHVLDAQQARGLPLEPGFKALRHYPAFLTPLLIQAFQLAEDLAEAMEARGFGRPGRTFYYDFKLSCRDWLAMAGGSLALSLYLLLLR